MHAFGQLSCREGKPCFILAWIRKQLQTFKETQSLKHSGVDADTHGVITGFNAPKCRTAGKGPFSDDRRWQTSTSACVINVEPELTQGTSDSRRGAMGCWHNGIFVFLYRHLM